MIVKNFKDTCAEYDNFQIWDVENMDAFLNGNGIFAKTEVGYKVRSFSNNDGIDENDRWIKHELFNEFRLKERKVGTLLFKKFY